MTDTKREEKPLELHRPLHVQQPPLRQPEPEPVPPRPKQEGQVAIYHKGTGAISYHWPVDAKDIVNAKNSEYTTDPVAPAAAATEDSADDDDESTDVAKLTRDELEVEAERLEINIADGKGENADGSYSVKQLRGKVSRALKKE